jgi:predicted deacylase
MQDGVFTLRLGRAGEEPRPDISRETLTVFEADCLAFALEKTVLHGPLSSARPPLKVALLAGFHGDEPGGPLAGERLYADFLHTPASYAGLELHLIPACNAWGLLFAHHVNADGLDPASSFGTGASSPEIRSLEDELNKRHYDVIISLHTDASSRGLYAYAGEDSFCHDFLIHALNDATEIYPPTEGSPFEGYHATQISPVGAFPGSPRPTTDTGHTFTEILLELPGRCDRHTQARTATAAVRAILARLTAR